MAAPCGVYLGSSFHIHRSHVFITEASFAAMICQPLKLCPMQDPDCSVGKFAVHSVSTSTAEVFVCAS